jgi:hypothetical protein
MTIRLPDEPKPLSDDPVFVRALALTGLSVCEAAARLHVWSPTLLCLSFITGLLASLNIGAIFLVFMASLVPAGCQAYFAWRLAFDRQVFAAWVRLRDDEYPEAQRAFDIALETLLKKEVSANDNRSMFDRVMGVRRLHQFQIAALLAQVLALLALVIGLLWVSGHV